MKVNGLESKVIDYYEGRLSQHGPSPAGVDWNSGDSQRRRFVELCRHIEPSHTVLDVGCGYGAFLEHLEATGWTADYIGFDLSAEMIVAARALHPDRGQFTTRMPSARSADIVVASGIFNVKFDIDEVEWQSYVDRVILSMFETCRVGMAFNLLTSFSDPDHMKPNLHYGSPARYFDFVATNCSRRVSLLHDYGLYEFTVLVRR